MSDAERLKYIPEYKQAGMKKKDFDLLRQLVSKANRQGWDKSSYTVSGMILRDGVDKIIFSHKFHNCLMKSMPRLDGFRWALKMLTMEKLVGLPESERIAYLAEVFL